MSVRSLTAARTRESVAAYAFLSPNLVLLGLFVFVPLVGTVVISLQKTDGFGSGSFVGADNYLRLHVGGRAYLCRGTMAAAEVELDPSRFVRVHRSALVAVDRIAQVQSAESGGYVLELSDGSRLRTSRQYADRVRALLR